MVPSIVLTDLVGGKGPLESARKLAKGLGKAVPTGALEEAEHPTDDRGGEAVASDDGGVAEAADRLAGSLGVELDERLNDRMKDVLRIDGILVLRVLPGSAAERAGLVGATVSRRGEVTPGDIITAVNQKQVETVSRLQSRLDEFAVGDTVTVTILRDGKTQDVAVTLQPGN